MITQKGNHSQIARLLLAAYFILALGYNLLTPPFEAPDEHHHFFTAVYIAQNGRLPVAQEDLARQEAAQPPLYYLLAAGLLQPFKTAVSGEMLWLNPFAQLGIAAPFGNANVFIHPESWPWPADIWAVHLLRLLSTLFGGLTLWAIYSSARLLWPQSAQRPLLALGLVAFLPQFLFLHAAVSNDSLIIAASSLAIWQLLRLWQTAVPMDRRQLLCLGLLLATAVLSKTAGLLLLGWVGLALFGLWWRYGRRRLLDILLGAALPALVAAGWLMGRNWQLYGDPSGASAFIALAGGDRGYGLGQALAELDRVAYSFFAYFGWMTLPAPNGVYVFWFGLTAVALLVAGWQLGRQRPWGHVLAPQLPGLWLAGWVGLVFAGWLQFMMRTPADQGRLLFPALLPLALALAYGLDRGRWALLTVGGAAATAVWCLFAVVQPAYARPAIIPLEAVPATAVLLQQPLGPLELVAAELPPQTVQPGEWVHATLYWRLRDGPPSQPPVLVLELLGRQLALAGKLHSYHGNGRYPASLWTGDGVVVEEVAVQLLPGTAVPSQGRLFVKLLDEAGQVEIGQLNLRPSQWPAVEETAVAQFGDGLSLLPVQVTVEGDVLRVRLRWQVTAVGLPDLTRFVHVGVAGQAPLAQADGSPLAGDYPTTWWQAGDLIDEELLLTLPVEAAGQPIHIGLYDPVTGVRLPVTVAGQRQPFDTYTVALGGDE